MTTATHQRKFLRFVEPRRQFLVMFPILAMLFFGALVSFSFMNSLRDGAVMLMRQAGVPEADVANYLASARALLGVFWVGVLFLVAVGFSWGWLVSHRIFGAFARLQRDLEEIGRGAKSPSDLRVRKGDYVFDLIESIRGTLVALTSGKT